MCLLFVSDITFSVVFVLVQREIIFLYVCIFQESLINFCFGKWIKERFDGGWTVQKVLNNENNGCTDMKMNNFHKLGLDCRNMHCLLQQLRWTLPLSSVQCVCHSQHWLSVRKEGRRIKLGVYREKERWHLVNMLLFNRQQGLRQNKGRLTWHCGHCQHHKAIVVQSGSSHGWCHFKPVQPE